MSIIYYGMINTSRKHTLIAPMQSNNIFQELANEKSLNHRNHRTRRFFFG